MKLRIRILHCSASVMLTAGLFVGQARAADAPESDTHSVRLYFNRDADAMAKVLDNAFTGLGVQAVGFRYIAGETSRNGFFDGYFADYVLQRRGEAKADPEFCDPEKYWLGYWQAFHPIPPSLTHMLRVLAASAEPAAAAHFVDCLEGQDTCG